MPDSLKLNSRGRYAVIAMVELAKAENKKPLPLSEIAENADISLSYLEQLIAGMRRHNLVKSYRGPGGGYILGKPSSAILIADILNAAEDSAPAKRNAAKTQKAATCAHTNALWSYIGELLSAALSKITLADVINNRLGNTSTSVKHLNS